MGNAPCSQVHHLSALPSRSRRVELRWSKPLSKGKGGGRVSRYRIEIAVDTVTQSAYQHAWLHWVPPPGHHAHLRERDHAGELAASAAAAAAPPNWITLEICGAPVRYWIKHERGHGEYSDEVRGLSNHVRYSFTLVAMTADLGDAPPPHPSVQATPVRTKSNKTQHD